jgi:predicted NBD/HSP70 family sugar kinase
LTGHVPGTTILRRGHADQPRGSHGSNHVALRADNERLVLSLIRSHGQLSRAQIAELSGLTAQTASVISRSLVDAGLLNAGAPVRGNIGQPYVPFSLNPNGAMFFGLGVDAAKVTLTLVDFTGSVIAEETHSRRSRRLPAVADLARAAMERMQAGLAVNQRKRIQDIGVSIASAAAKFSKGDGELPWQEADEVFGRLAASVELVAHVSSDAKAACSAELIYGIASGLQDFAYVFVDTSISGGLVHEARMRFSRDVGGSNIGKVLVLDRDRRRMVPLWTLAARLGADASDKAALDDLAHGIAHAVHSISAVANFDTVIVDGTIAPETRTPLVTSIKKHLSDMDADATAHLTVREGSLARKSTAFGAACLPLVDRFFPQETLST